MNIVGNLRNGVALLVAGVIAFVTGWGLALALSPYGLVGALLVSVLMLAGGLAIVLGLVATVTWLFRHLPTS